MSIKFQNCHFSGFSQYCYNSIWGALFSYQIGVGVLYCCMRGLPISTLREETWVLEYLNTLISSLGCNDLGMLLSWNVFTFQQSCNIGEFKMYLHTHTKKMKYRMQIHCNPMSMFIFPTQCFSSQSVTIRLLNIIVRWSWWSVGKPCN